MSFRKSLQKRRVLSSFGTRTIGLAQGLREGSMTPSCSIFFISSSIAGRRASGIRKGRCWTTTPGGVRISCSMMVVLPSVSLNTSLNCQTRALSSVFWVADSCGSMSTTGERGELLHPGSPFLEQVHMVDLLHSSATGLLHAVCNRPHSFHHSVGPLPGCQELARSCRDQNHPPFPWLELPGLGRMIIRPLLGALGHHEVFLH